MESIQLSHNFSRNILLRMTVIGLVVVGLLYWKFDLINNIYFRNQLTPTGMVINGAILLLFLTGLARLIQILVRYHREEKAVRMVMANLAGGADPMGDIPEDRIISRRFRTMEELHKSNTPINHNALASTLVASESTQNSFPRFINNTLILTGVFGTIVSLSVALLGASDLLESVVNVDGMGLVVHGMSTALSTTITAIICYVYFGYFFLKTGDVETNLVSAVEQITTSYFMPRFQVHTETVLHQFAGLIRSLQGLIGQLKTSQDSYGHLATQMQDSQTAFEDLETRIVTALVDVYRSKLQPITTDMEDIKSLLKLGFRLPDEPAPDEPAPDEPA